MDFEWDEDKAASNYRKHRVRFDVAREAILDPFALIDEDSTASGEQRFRLIGRSLIGLLYVIYTERRENTIRIISARRAEKHEQREYIRALP